MVQSKRFGSLVGAVDEGTGSARFLIFASETAEVLTYHQIEINSIYPKEGWVEQDPEKILDTVNECIVHVVNDLKQIDIDPRDIVTVGITNQRETVIVWDKITGKPLYNAIVWLDTRNKDTVDKYIAKTKGFDANYLKSLCGLPISTYFSALKIRWLIDNVPSVQKAIENKRCYFGNVDSWLIWNLTGGNAGGLHMTDVTNASRTMLMNIHTLKWDPVLLKFFDIPLEILPEIRSSSEVYACITNGVLQGVPISGCLGDQQAALVGQMCLKPGQVKNTYGTGCFLLCNTGSVSMWSNHGLLTTVAYRFGPTAPVIYALEGSVAVAGAAITWLRDRIEMIKDTSELDEIDTSDSRFTNIYFVPAFSGLYAPYWRKDARSVFCGLSMKTGKTDILKAVLEAICFQTRDILEAMYLDCGQLFAKNLLVDGGMSNNDFLMQLQADLTGKPVVRPVMTETTALGAAIVAGIATGINVWDLNNMQPTATDIFLPQISSAERNMKYSRWKMAISRSFGWESSAEVDKNGNASLYGMIPLSIFLITAFAFITVTDRYNVTSS